MAITNYDRVGKALQLLQTGMKPFVEREMVARYKNKWQGQARMWLQDDYISASKGEINWDVSNLLSVMWNGWHEVFKNILGKYERTLISELRLLRNRWAHQEVFNSDDTYRAIDSVKRLLEAVSADEAVEAGRIQQELLRTKYEEQRRTESRKIVSNGKVESLFGLKPWREVITPHPDVASGRYQQAEFAADLWQVYLGEALSEYQDPSEFYKRTFLTEGLKQLLISALRRLNGKGGDPVIDLQTNFGGGKTHSILALFHLCSGAKAADLQGIENILSNEHLEIPKDVNRAVIVGSRISPGQIHKKADGTTIRTLWGEIAWQLGGKEGYKYVKDADQSATNPGDALRELFNRYSPCIVLIDEWVAYARCLHEERDLPAGTFDTQFTFAQALTESIKGAPKAMLVVSIPASDNEVGGTSGRSALERLKNVIGRLESPWRPASSDEGFEIVRRRLFEPILEPKLSAYKDAVAHEYVNWYLKQRNEFPAGCSEGGYEKRIKSSYPIHPELFDRLYNDWSSLDKFQRTRGVLRLMAAVIHSLWENQDPNPLIIPANVPIDDPKVQRELLHYLEENWAPVVEKDVDGSSSLPLSIDRDNPNLGKFGACRRVARTIFIGSAPTLQGANRGIDEQHVKLGCVQPGESIATFGDALRRLTDSATYLYVDGKKYWYSTQPTVNRLAEDRATQLAEDDVYEEIKKILREQSKHRAEFSRVHICASDGDIPDEKEARLVILSPELSHSTGLKDSPAIKESEKIINNRGSSPRIYRNTLVFISVDKTRLMDLEQSVRQLIAWRSIMDDNERLNLDSTQKRQADSKLQSADKSTELRLSETYIWLLVPSQPDPKGAPEWTEIKLQAQDHLAIKVCKKLMDKELLIVKMGGVRLRHDLDKIPLWRGDDVNIRQLSEDFAKYTYLPRLKDEKVLEEAINDGIRSMLWRDETFAYAEKWDSEKKKYLGLVGGKIIKAIINSDTLLVKSEAADKQMKMEEVLDQLQKDQQSHAASTGAVGDQGQVSVSAPVPEKKIRRFYGTVKLDPTRIARDAGNIGQEIVQHLAALPGSNLEITIDIQAKIPNGVPDNIIRTVLENCRTLKFEVSEFEEE